MMNSIHMDMLQTLEDALRILSQKFAGRDEDDEDDEDYEDDEDEEWDWNVDDEDEDDEDDYEDDED